MEGSKEWLIRMREEEYSSLPFEVRQSFLSEKVQYSGEHQRLYKEDPTYKELYKTYRKAKKDMEEYKFRKRHADSRSNSRELPKSKG